MSNAMAIVGIIMAMTEENIGVGRGVGIFSLSMLMCIGLLGFTLLIKPIRLWLETVTRYNITWGSALYSGFLLITVFVFNW